MKIPRILGVASIQTCVHCLPILLLLLSPSSFAAVGGWGSLPAGITLQAVDYNNDGQIDNNDVNVLLAVVGGRGCPAGKVCDLNGDGLVNQADLTLLEQFTQNGPVALPSQSCLSSLASGAWPEDQYTQDPGWPQSYWAWNGAGYVTCTPTYTDQQCYFEGWGYNCYTLNHANCSLSCAPPQTQVSACETISSSGYYVLTADLPNSVPSGSTCLNIENVYGVVLDCQGHRIAAPNSISVSNVQGFSIINCAMGPANAGQTVYANNLVVNQASYGTVLNNVIGETLSNSGYDVVVSNANSINFSSNTLGATYGLYTSYNNTVSSNLITSPISGIPGDIVSSCVSSDAGSGNTVANNTINGRATGSYTGDVGRVSGADDGILFYGESNVTLENNVITNTWDAGIEWVGLLNNATIAGNNISNAGVAGISSYWNMSLSNSTMSHNTVSQSGALFVFTLGVRNNPPPSQALSFANNNFVSNSLTNPTSGGYPYGGNYIPIFSGSEFFGFPMSLYPVSNVSINITNNVFTDNSFWLPVNFGGSSPVPGQLIDGGGNTCVQNGQTVACPLP